MPVGDSGRIVIEVDPELKKELYQLVKADGASLKEWFLERVDEYIEQHSAQQNLLDKRGRPIRRAS